MLLELVRQVEMRLPENNIFKCLSNLAPKKVLSHTNRAKLNELPNQKLLESRGLSTIEGQYAKIVYHPWIEEHELKTAYRRIQLDFGLLLNRPPITTTIWPITR